MKVQRFLFYFHHFLLTLSVGRVQYWTFQHFGFYGAKLINRIFSNKNGYCLLIHFSTFYFSENLAKNLPKLRKMWFLKCHFSDFLVNLKSLKPAKLEQSNNSGLGKKFLILGFGISILISGPEIPDY